MSEIRTRIAPSPTGYMHIGTLRTLLWDLYMARQKGGTFIIRVEDTDRERFVPGSIEALLKSLKEMNIEWDEGPILNEDGTLGEKGAFGPYTQTQRLDIYKKYADQLLEAGHAYHCFCTSERLEKMRADQMARKETPKYDRHCLQLTPEEIKTRLDALQPGDAHVIRMRIPEGTSSFDDAIRGTVTFNNADVDDQVIVKTNGIPTYHLAVVIDDYLMKISHVLRGEEWISSTPKQIILHDMLDLPMPVYAHVPLILNPDKTKLSKRKGDVAVEGFLEKGYLPEALKNFIATLGFNPTGDREIYTEQELTDLFDISKVNRSGAVMNMEKLDWMNGQYMKQMDDVAFLEQVKKFTGRDLSPFDQKLAIIEKQRAHTLHDVQTALDVGLEYNENYDAELLIWKKSDAADARMQLEGIKEILENGAGESAQEIETTIKSHIEKNALQNGNVLWPLRVALSGSKQSLSPFELLWLLSVDESIKRINIAIAKL